MTTDMCPAACVAPGGGRLLTRPLIAADAGHRASLTPRRYDCRQGSSVILADVQADTVGACSAAGGTFADA